MKFEEIDKKAIKENLKAVEDTVNNEIKSRNNPILSSTARVSAYMTRIINMLKK
jgi:hypothetical protein